MSARHFFDSNILLYAHDKDAPAKQNIARGLLLEHAAQQTGVLSTQVLQEFYVNAVRALKFKPRAARRETEIASRLDVAIITPALVLEGIDISIESKLSMWDGLIVAAAVATHCSVLLTEDLNHGQIIRGVRVENPFH